MSDVIFTYNAIDPVVVMRETLNLRQAHQFMCAEAARRAGEIYCEGERRLRPVPVMMTDGTWVVEIQHNGTVYSFLRSK